MESSEHQNAFQRFIFSTPMLLIPVVAMCISGLIEDYQWSLYAIAGIFMMILGNIVITFKEKILKFYYKLSRSISN